MKIGIRSIFIIMVTIAILLLTHQSTTVAHAGTTILFLGDSLTAGYGVEKEEAFPALLEGLLGEKGYTGLKLINAGISGSTTAGGLSRLKWYKRAKPDVLFLALGANDGLRGLSLHAMESNLESIIESAKKEGMRVILAGMEIPPNYGDDYTRHFREVFAGLAQKHDIPLMPFLLKDVGGIAGLNQSDGIHPTPKGHKIIAANVLPYLLQMLKEM